jgi:hypothetical protein
MSCEYWPLEGRCPHERPRRDEHDDGCDLDSWGTCPGEIIEKEKSDGEERSIDTTSKNRETGPRL